VTLQGFVLAVGGIKEKLMAAHRAGVTHVLVRPFAISLKPHLRCR